MRQQQQHRAAPLRKPRFLYHGTVARHVGSIRERGILSRAELGSQSNYQGMLESKPNLVYLSTLFPVPYAISALGDDPDDDIAIIKVDTSRLELVPDEDFLARARLIEEGLPISADSLAERIVAEEPSEYSESTALHSLEQMGVIATPSVPPKLILETRVVPMRGNLHGTILHFLGWDTDPHARFGLPEPIRAEFDGTTFFYLEMLFRDGLESLHRWVEDEIAMLASLDRKAQSERHADIKDDHRRYYLENFDEVYFGGQAQI